MSNFVTKLLPFLPAYVQFEQLAEAASHFNRFSERLSAARTTSEERELVLGYLGQVRQELGKFSDADERLIFDYFSVIVYLSMLEHWAIPVDADIIDPIPWIGRLMNSQEPRIRRFGCLAASVPSLFDSESQEGASLLLANTIAKLLDSADREAVEAALKLAPIHLTSFNHQLLSPGIIRALRSRHKSIRKYAWLAIRTLTEFEPAVQETITESWDQLAMGEPEVDVLCALCTFVDGVTGCDDKIVRWLDHLQEALLKRPFPILQIKVLRLFKKYSLSICYEEILKATSDAAVHLELLRSIDRTAENDILTIPSRQFREASTFHLGLILLEPMAQLSPKSVLHYQKELLEALGSDDPQVRILALQCLRHAANEENVGLLIDNCDQIIHICKAHEAELIAKALEIKVEFISRFQRDPLKLMMEALDELPESVCEEHADPIYTVIISKSEGNYSFIDREYAIREHSLMHQLVLHRMCGYKLEPHLAWRLLTEQLRLPRDDLRTIDILGAMLLCVGRGDTSCAEQLNTSDISLFSDHRDRRVRWLAKAILTGDKEMLAQFKEDRVAYPEAAFEELEEIFDSARLSAPKRAEPVEGPPVEQPNFVTEVPMFSVVEEEGTPGPLTSPQAIKSDIFKGLL